MLAKNPSPLGTLVRRLWPPHPRAERRPDDRLPPELVNQSGARNGHDSSLRVGRCRMVGSLAVLLALVLVLTGRSFLSHPAAAVHSTDLRTWHHPIGVQEEGVLPCDHCEVATATTAHKRHTLQPTDRYAERREVSAIDVAFALASMRADRRQAALAWMCPDSNGVLAADALYHPTPSRSLKGFTAFYLPRARCRHPFIAMRLRGQLLWSSYGSEMCGLGLERQPMGVLHLNVSGGDGDDGNGVAACFAVCAARRCCAAFQTAMVGGPRSAADGGIHDGGGTTERKATACWLYRCIPLGTPRHLASALGRVAADEVAEASALHVLVSRRRPQVLLAPASSHRLIARAFGNGVWHVQGFELPLPPHAEVVVVDALGDVVGAAHGTLGVTITAESNAVVFSAMVPLSSGRARIAGAVAQAQGFVGQALRVDLVATLVTAGGEAVEHASKLSVLVHRLSNAYELVADAPLLHGEGIVDPRVCGAHLAFPNECCIQEAVRAYHTHSDYDGVDASLPSSLNTIAVLRISGTKPSSSTAGTTSGDAAPSGASCIALVDGFYTKFSAAGVALFDSIVFENTCVDHEDGADNGDASVQVLLEVGNATVATLGVPIRLLANRCAAIARRRANHQPLPPMRDGDVAGDQPFPIHRMDGDAAPILISIAVHRCKSCLIRLLCNIAAFVGPTPPCVVLHLSPQEHGGALSHHEVHDALSSSELRACKHFNGQPVAINQTLNVFVNTNPPVFRPNQFLHVVHMSNVAYVLKVHPQQAWSHVVWLQSNERIVKPGLAQYVQRFDVSRATIASAQAGLTRQHAPLVRTMTGDQLYQEATHIKSLLLAPLRDANFASLLHQLRRAQVLPPRNKTAALEAVYPSINVLSEGTFMNRSIAERLSHAVLASFDPTVACETEGIAHEYTTQLLLRAFCDPALVGDSAADHRRSRCGEKVSMLAWNNDDYIVSPADVRFAQCSPFAPPFSMKRFPDNADAIWMAAATPPHNTTTNPTSSRAAIPRTACIDARKLAIRS